MKKIILTVIYFLCTTIAHAEDVNVIELISKITNQKSIFSPSQLPNSFSKSDNDQGFDLENLDMETYAIQDDKVELFIQFFTRKNDGKKSYHIKIRSKTDEFGFLENLINDLKKIKVDNISEYHTKLFISGSQDKHTIDYIEQTKNKYKIVTHVTSTEGKENDKKVTIEIFESKNDPILKKSLLIKFLLTEDISYEFKKSILNSPQTSIFFIDFNNKIVLDRNNFYIGKITKISDDFFEFETLVNQFKTSYKVNRDNGFYEVQYFDKVGNNYAYGSGETDEINITSKKY